MRLLGVSLTGAQTSSLTDSLIYAQQGTLTKSCLEFRLLAALRQAKSSEPEAVVTGSSRATTPLASAKALNLRSERLP